MRRQCTGTAGKITNCLVGVFLASILAVKALHELRRTGGRYALSTMCIGGGQGMATIFERE